ncbi:hypothetical protein [Polynucleobacter sp. MWH-Svant-W18]|uniref:hypothetical protein n=1 Tax=Polynucleobacter sp. MWH-Svant-W18 TaxID=1855909 RepID=UPI001BFD7F7D|nr:hypothetical protein [Polynucleobacter sp. MWH-Svant-W18]QWD77730.1 hypothetical protein C2757_07560 [Polynucleobacter sp. MWH-Svant-W18]
MEQVVLLQGGMGDFLQCIPFVKSNKHGIKYVCVTHLKGAKLFFEAFGIKLESLSTFNSEQEKIELLNSLPRGPEYINCPRTQYFDVNPLDIEQPLFDNSKPVVGIHINGSAYSIKTQKQFGMVLKSIPAKVIKELISNNYNVIVFGLRHEIEPIGLTQSDTLRLVSHENPAKSLAYIQQCNAVIASDSGIKTMSSMLRIPTLVWLGDYQDFPRDQMFIDPYVSDGVMKVFRYKDVHAQFNQGIRVSKDFLQAVL